MATPDVAGKTVIITGGSSGLGLEMAKYFGQRNAHIAILDIEATRGSDVVSSLKSEFTGAKFSFHQCDVTKWEQQAEAFKKIYDEFGSIDYVYANAGIALDLFYIPDDGEPKKPELKTIDVCLYGCIYTVHLAIHYMRRSKAAQKGWILCTASDAGLYNFYPAPIYGAAKHGVIGLVRSTGRVMAEEGIHINGIAPNYIPSNLSDPSIAEVQYCTPISSVVKAVDDFVKHPEYFGKISEVSGDEPGFYYRDQVEYCDDHTKDNFVGWWDLAVGGIVEGEDGKPTPKRIADERAKAQKA